MNVKVAKQRVSPMLMWSLPSGIRKEKFIAGRGRVVVERDRAVVSRGRTAVGYSNVAAGCDRDQKAKIQIKSQVRPPNGSSGRL